MHAWLLNILRCPDDGQSPLVLRQTPAPGPARVEEGELECTVCGRRFAIREGIPTLLPRDLDDPGRAPASAAPVETAATAGRDMLREMEARDDEAELYDRLYEDRAYRFELDCYRAQLAPRPGELVLDVGCGTGRFTKEYAAAVGRVVAADFSQESLRRLSRRLAPALAERVQAVQCAVGHLPFPDGVFDAAVATSLFSNVPTARTREAGRDEVHRVLAPGARLLVTVYNHCWSKRVQQRLGLSRSGAKAGYHSNGRIPYYNFDPREFERWVAARFRPGPVFGAHHRMPLLSRAAPSLAPALDRLLYHTPLALRVFAREMGMLAVKTSCAPARRTDAPGAG